jgi:hypothetical protein
LVEFSANLLELALELAESSGRQSEVLLGAAYVLSKRGVLAHKLLNPLLVGVDLLGREAVLVSELVQLGSQAGGLLGRQSQVLLGLLNFTSEGSDFVVLLLDDAVEALDLLSHLLSHDF